MKLCSSNICRALEIDDSLLTMSGTSCRVPPGRSALVLQLLYLFLCLPFISMNVQERRWQVHLASCSGQQDPGWVPEVADLHACRAGSGRLRNGDSGANGAGSRRQGGAGAEVRGTRGAPTATDTNAACLSQLQLAADCSGVQCSILHVRLKILQQ